MPDRENKLASSRRSPFSLSFFDKSFSNFTTVLVDYWCFCSSKQHSKPIKMLFISFLFAPLFFQQLSSLIPRLISRFYLLLDFFAFHVCDARREARRENSSEEKNDRRKRKMLKIHLCFGDLIYM